MYINEEEKAALKHVIDNKNIPEEDRELLQGILEEAEGTLIECSYDKNDVLRVLQDAYWEDLDDDDFNANSEILLKDEIFSSRIQRRIEHSYDYCNWGEFSEVVCDIFEEMYAMKDNGIVRRETD